MMPKHKVVVFDLDDTLYKEIDFLKSAYREISDFLCKAYGVKGLFEKMLHSRRIDRSSCLVPGDSVSRAAVIAL